MSKKIDIEIWTTEETSEFLRVSSDYVRNLARKKLIPHHRLTEGGKILFNKNKVVEWFFGLEQEVEEESKWDEEAQSRFIDQHLGSNQ